MTLLANALGEGAPYFFPKVNQTHFFIPIPAPVEWVPTTPANAHTLADRAVVAGYEGYDQSPLWIIRAKFEGDVIPGKLAAKHRSAYVPWGGAENAVQNIEVSHYWWSSC